MNTTTFQAGSKVVYERNGQCVLGVVIEVVPREITAGTDLVKFRTQDNQVWTVDASALIRR